MEAKLLGRTSGTTYVRVCATSILSHVSLTQMFG